MKPINTISKIASQSLKIRIKVTDFIKKFFFYIAIVFNKNDSLTPN